MNTLTKLALGLIGQLKPLPPVGDGRTAPSAMNAQEVLLYVAMPDGLYLYEPRPHALRQVVAGDVRRVTGPQDFVDTAPLDLVYGAGHARAMGLPAGHQLLLAQTVGAVKPGP